MSDDSMDQLRVEQTAFDQQLGEMLKQHKGEFAVFFEGKNQGFYSTYQAAYSDALQKFGMTALFLVSEIKERSTYEGSISWYAGVLVE